MHASEIDEQIPEVLAMLAERPLIHFLDRKLAEASETGDVPRRMHLRHRRRP